MISTAARAPVRLDKQIDKQSFNRLRV